MFLPPPINWWILCLPSGIRLMRLRNNCAKAQGSYLNQDGEGLSLYHKDTKIKKSNSYLPQNPNSNQFYNLWHESTNRNFQRIHVSISTTLSPFTFFTDLYLIYFYTNRISLLFYFTFWFLIYGFFVITI